MQVVWGGRGDGSGMAWHACRLIPRMFPPPVFNHLQHAHTEGANTYLHSARLEVGMACKRVSKPVEL